MSKNIKKGELYEEMNEKTSVVMRCCNDDSFYESGILRSGDNGRLHFG